jgi:hypothetical protein
MTTAKYPFSVPYSEIEAEIDVFIDTVFDTLQSSFLLLPRGPGFVAYSEFQQAYEVLKRRTTGFTLVEPENVLQALQEDALTFIVLRAILGFTPSELAYIASEKSAITVSQSFARNLDRQIRTERQAQSTHISQGPTACCHFGFSRLSASQTRHRRN